MSLSNTGRLLLARTPLIQAIRNRTPDIRKKDIPHWSRAIVLKVVTPMYRYADEETHPVNTCEKHAKTLEKQLKEKEINTFEEIMAKEVYETINNAKFVAIFHKYCMSQAELYAARLQLKKINLTYIHHNKSIMNLAFTGTKYEAMIKLYESHSVTFVSDEVNVGKLLKMEKRIPGLLLLGGVVDGRLLSVADLKHYSQLPSIDVMRAQVTHTLSSAAQSISQNLVAHQMDLSSALTRYIDKDSTTTPEESQDN